MNKENKVRYVLGSVVKRIDNRTLVVSISTICKHPLYKKFLKKVSKLLVHDEHGIAQVGDNVNIVSTRPISKRKSWKLV